MTNTNYIYTRSCWFCSEAILYYSASLLTILRVNLDVVEVYWFEIDQSGSTVPQVLFLEEQFLSPYECSPPFKKEKDSQCDAQAGLSMARS